MQLIPAGPASGNLNDRSNTGRPAASKSQSAPSTPAEAQTSHPETVNASPSMTQLQEEMPQTSTAHIAAPQPNEGDASATEPDLDDLDALLNAPTMFDKSQKVSTTVLKPPHQEQDLEDWLNSL